MHEIEFVLFAAQGIHEIESINSMSDTSIEQGI